MTSFDLRKIAASIERGELSDQEQARVVSDIVKTHAENMEGYKKHQEELAKVQESIERTFPRLLNRAEQAEAMAGCLLVILSQYMDEDELQTELRKLYGEMQCKRFM